MRAAMEDAGVTPREIGFVNAHGTATRANDLCESRSLRRILGDAAPGVWVASNKSFFGHLLGAAGVVETVATLLGLEQGRVPPNLHLEHPDPAAELRLVGPRSEPVSSPLAMKNSFGFGGGNAVLILGKAPGGDRQN
jgi:3-oxoacyl-[acyl-carrier-protein] synthase II